MTSDAQPGKGILAGFVATMVLSMVMLMKQAMSLMPELNPVQMITQMIGAQTPAVGWLIHFMIGTIIGDQFQVCLSRSNSAPEACAALAIGATGGVARSSPCV